MNRQFEPRISAATIVVWVPLLLAGSLLLKASDAGANGEETVASPGSATGRFESSALGNSVPETARAGSGVVEGWQSIATGRTLDMTILEPESRSSPGPYPVVIYLKRLAATRIGTESDEAILRDLLTSGHLVVTLDYDALDEAQVPFINRDFAKLRDEIRNGSFPAGYKIDPAHVFIVPGGSRLKRDVVFYKDENRTLAMDIIYPSRPSRAVGAIIEFSCDNRDRTGSVSLSICSDTLLDGEATEGFAVAMADHPVAPPYKGLDPMPESAWKIKAAVRTLRAEGENLELNGNVGVVGFSRGSGMALMLVSTEDMAEFEGHGMNPGFSSDVQAAVIMSGRFTYLDLLEDDHMLPRYTKAWGERDSNLDVWRQHGAMDFHAESMIPLFLTINCTEGPDALYQMQLLRCRLAELGNDATFKMDRVPRGHKVTLDPEILEAMNDYLRNRLN